jgi:hypothetical protein
MFIWVILLVPDYRALEYGVTELVYGDIFHMPVLERIHLYNL